MARICRSLSQKTGISKSFSPLAFSSPAIIQNNKTLDAFPQGKKNNNRTLSKRFVTVIDYRAEKNKIILKEKTYR